MSQGVVYYIGGADAVRLLVSLWSLRRPNPEKPIYSGLITVFTTCETTNAIGSLLKADNRLAVDHQTIVPVGSTKRDGLATKTKVAINPRCYDCCLYLDADTIVLAPVDAFFDYVSAAGIVVTEYSNKTTEYCARDLREWKGLDEVTDLRIDRLLSCPAPAINTGVLGFQRGNPVLEAWYHFTLRGRGKPTGDELALQILLADLPKARRLIIDDSWNCSAHCGVHRGQVHIWHFDDQSHRNTDIGRNLWWPSLREVFDLNLGSIQTWARWSSIRDDPDYKAIYK